MIVLDEKEIKSLNDFSSEFFTFLKWIKGGYEWLDWAVNHAKAVMCAAKDENDLLINIHTGLNVTDYLKFDNFQIGLDKALTIDISEMAIISESLKGLSSDEIGEEHIKSKYKLINNEQLETNRAFLTGNKIENSPIFHNLTFRESCLLYKFQTQFKHREEIDSAGIKFAISKAVSTDEFINYYSFYRNIFKKQIKVGMTPQRTQEVLDKSFKDYNFLCNYLIMIPNLGIGNSDKELREGLPAFVKTIQFIGFRTKAAAMNNLSKNIAVKEDGNLDNDAIEDYMAGIGDLINKADEIPECTLSQDGSMRTFSIQSGESYIILDIDKKGDMSLSPDSIINY